jgi:hypothetical protein
MKQVAAGAKWVAQVDLDAAHASTVLKNAYEKMIKEHPGAEVMLAGIRGVWKFDLRTDLHGLTFYGEQLKKDTGVVLVHATRDENVSNLLVEKAKTAPGYQAISYGKHELHTWTHAKGRKSPTPTCRTSVRWASRSRPWGCASASIKATRSSTSR